MNPGRRRLHHASVEIERGADPALKDKSGKSALGYASDAKHAEVQKALREAEAAKRKA